MRIAAVLTVVAFTIVPIDYRAGVPPPHPQSGFEMIAEVVSGRFRTGTTWEAWPADPTLQIALWAAGVVYFLGFSRRRRVLPSGTPAWRSWRSGGGLAAVAAAQLSPVAAFSERLFFVPMVQHLLLLFVAPLLRWFGAPFAPSLWGLPIGVRRWIGRSIAPGGTLARMANPVTLPWVAAAAFVGFGACRGSTTRRKGERSRTTSSTSWSSARRCSTGGR